MYHAYCIYFPEAQYPPFISHKVSRWVVVGGGGNIYIVHKYIHYINTFLCL